MNVSKLLVATIAISLITVASASPAMADLVCLRSTIKSGKVVNTVRNVTTATCPRGFKAIVDTNVLKASGLVGPQGPKGDPGTSGLLNFSIEVGIGTATSQQNEASAYAACPDGKALIGGSAGVTTGLAVAASLPIAISYSAPVLFSATPQFFARAYETSAVNTSWQIYVYAFCANIN